MEEPRAMQEIHEWQMQIYKDEKNLSAKERVELGNELMNKFVKKNNLEYRVILEDSPENRKTA